MTRKVTETVSPIKLRSSPRKGASNNTLTSDTASQILTPKRESTLDGKLSSARKAFHAETSDSGLVCREDETKEMTDFLLQHLEEKTSASMYVSGLPGTGKTATLLKVLENEKVVKGYHKVYINCTAVKSASSIYVRICEALKIKLTSKSEKNALAAINKYLPRKHKMVLLVLDEMDQLESRFQTVLYTMFEWPALKDPRLVLVGVANAVDLTDRLLPRLCASASKPILLHFRPYNKDQIVTILKHRLADAEDLVFAPGALELLSAKVAGQSGDLRRALDLARRVLDVAQPSATPKTQEDSTPKRLEAAQSKTPTKRPANLMAESNSGAKKSPWKSPRRRGSLEPKRLSLCFDEPEDLIPVNARLQKAIKEDPPTSPRRSPRKHDKENTAGDAFSVRAMDVVRVVNQTFGSGRSLGDNGAFPLHQKLLVCTLLLILSKAKNKDVSVGKLHEVYGRVCTKRGITAVDQSGFIFLCRQVEMTGALLVGKGPPRLAKISLQWDEDEIAHAVQDSGLLSTICNDTSCLTAKKC